MSFNIVSIIMQHLSPELIVKLAKATGMERVIAEKAIGALVPGMLGDRKSVV